MTEENRQASGSLVHCVAVVIVAGVVVVVAGLFVVIVEKVDVVVDVAMLLLTL